jgi:hypothetical protein
MVKKPNPHEQRPLALLCEVLKDRLNGLSWAQLELKYKVPHSTLWDCMLFIITWISQDIIIRSANTNQPPLPYAH